MTGLEFTLLIIVWHIAGLVFTLIIGSNAEHVRLSSGMEYVNPVFIYSNVKVNAFGAIVLALVYHVFLPIPAVCYWFYKLCTFGRKYDV